MYDDPDNPRYACLSEMKMSSSTATNPVIMTVIAQNEQPQMREKLPHGFPQSKELPSTCVQDGDQC